MKNLLTPEAKVWFQKSIQSELTAANTYKCFANCMQRLGFVGAQKYFTKESADELTHAQILFDLINDLGDLANIPTIEAVEFMPAGIGEALDFAFDMELALMEQYKEFYKFIEETDPVIAQQLLQFLNIQIKSVGEYGDLQMRYSVAEKTQEILFFDDYLSEL